MGYEPLTKGYRFLAPDKRTIIVSRSAKFCESAPEKARQQEIYLPIPVEPHGFQEASPRKPSGEPEEGGADEQQQLTPSRQGIELKQEATTPAEQAASPQRRIFDRSTRGVPPQRLIVGKVSTCTDLEEPRAFHDLCQLPQSEKQKWLEAMQEEMDAMQRLKCV